MRTTLSKAGTFAIALTFGALAVFADASPSAADPPDDAVKTSGARMIAGDGMQAFIDPESGALREPTRKEREEMALQSGKAELPAPSVPRVTRHKDGSETAVVGTAFLQWVKAQRRPNGRLAVGHDLVEDPAGKPGREEQ